jgi:hypothetical protein
MCSTDCETCRRLRAGLVDSLGEQGLGLLTIDVVAARCGLDGDVKDHRCGTLVGCVLDAYIEEAQRIFDMSELAFCGDRPWMERYRRVLGEVIELFIARPGVTRLCLGEEEAAVVPALREYRNLGRDRWVSLLEREHARSMEQQDLPTVYFELLAGAAFQMLQRTFLAGRPEELRSVPMMIDRLVPAFEPIAG